MSNNSIFKIALLGFLALALGLASFFFLDYKNIKVIPELFKSDLDLNIKNQDYSLFKKGNLDLDIELIEMDLKNSQLTIEESKDFRYEIYRNYDDLDIDLVKSASSFSFIDKSKNSSDKISRINLYLPNEKLVEIDFKGLNSNAEIKADLKGLNFKSTNSYLNINGNMDWASIDTSNGNIEIYGQLNDLNVRTTNSSVNLEGPRAYNMDVQSSNGLINILFTSYDAELVASTSNGSIEILDENFGFLNSKKVKKVLGDGSKLIKLKTTNGLINLQ